MSCISEVADACFPFAHDGLLLHVFVLMCYLIRQDRRDKGGRPVGGEQNASLPAL
jgi:hypothetical protein